MICWEHTAVTGFGACCLLDFGTVSLKIVEDGVIPSTVPPEADFFLHFSKEIPLLSLLRRAALGPTYLFSRD